MSGRAPKDPVRAGNACPVTRRPWIHSRLGRPWCVLSKWWSMSVLVTGSDCRGRDRRHKVWVGASGPNVALGTKHPEVGLMTIPALTRWMRLFPGPVDSEGASRTGSLESLVFAVRRLD